MKSSLVKLALLLNLMTSMAFAQAPFKIGDMAPEFKLPYSTKDTIVFSGIGSQDLAGKQYLLAFYPADWSSGCTKEVCTFRDAMIDFNNLDVTVLGVSVDGPFAHHQWARDEDLNFKLLSDQTHKFGIAMGVYSEEAGVFKRSVFVVGPDGRFRYIDYDYSVKDDVDFKALKSALAEK